MNTIAYYGILELIHDRYGVQQYWDRQFVVIGYDWIGLSVYTTTDN